MSDPTGISALILGIILFGYWGVGLVCLGLAISMPRNKLVKALLGLLVIGLFVGLPRYLRAMREAERQDQRAEVQAACLRGKLASSEMSPVPGFYTGQGALPLVWGSSDREKLSLDPSLDDIVGYMLDRKMSFLEMAWPPTNSHLHHELLKLLAQTPKTPHVRLSIVDAGTTQCAPIVAWADEYPAQRLPPLRRRGLLADHCIAVDAVKEPVSRYRITSQVKPAVLVPGTQYGLWEHTLQVQDTRTAAATATFRLFVNRNGYGDRMIACGQRADVQRFQQIVPVQPDPRVVPPKEVTVDEPAAFPIVAAATPDDVAEIGKLSGIGKMNSTNIISEDGLVWFESNYKTTDSNGSFTHDWYFLTLAFDGELRRTLVRMSSISVRWITGLQVTPERIRFIASADVNTDAWLLEYSRKGEPVRALSLTPDQVERLK